MQKGTTGMFKMVLAACAALSLSATSTLAQPAAARAVLGACKPDIKQFCSEVPPGNGRIKACMKAHLPELSEPCKEALFQAWLNK
jgi:Cysteine rich repeat